MAKKKKQNLQQLIAKKQKLQQVTQGAVISFEPQTEIVSAPKTEAAIVTEELQATPNTSGRELKKTAVSIVLIAVLLVAAVIVDKKLPYFSEFGNWLYRALRLQA